MQMAPVEQHHLFHRMLASEFGDRAAELTPAHREVIFGRAVLGSSWRQLSLQSGVYENTLRSRFRAAMRVLGVENSHAGSSQQLWRLTAAFWFFAGYELRRTLDVATPSGAVVP